MIQHRTKPAEGLHMKKIGCLLMLLCAAALLLCACRAQEAPADPPGSDTPEIVDPQEAAQPAGIDGPLLTVHDGVQDIDAYESFLWSTQWQDDGSGISADGMDPESVIREDANRIPVLRYDGLLFFTCREDAEVMEKSLQIYADGSMQMISQFADLNGDWLSELKSRGPGKYWCCQKVRVQGQYVPAANDYNSSCYACLFCLEIPPAEEEAVPEEYLELFGDLPSVPAEELRNEPVVVTDQEARIYNKRLLDDFYAKVQEGTPAEVMLACYPGGEEYADKPVLVSLRYDGSKIRMIEDYSRAGFGSGSDYNSDTFSYAMVFDSGREEFLLLSDKRFDDYDAYQAALEAMKEDETEERMAWLEYHPEVVLYWKKVMPE